MPLRAFPLPCTFQFKFPRIIIPLHSQHPQVFSGTLVAIYLLSRTHTVVYVEKVELLLRQKGEESMLGTILIVVLILLFLGAIPTWPHSRQWGYYPSGGLGLVLLILIILMLLGRL